jgi:hypothetical protein
VLIDSAGQLGTLSSSRRFKKEIKPMGKASEVLLALRNGIMNARLQSSSPIK